MIKTNKSSVIIKLILLAILISVNSNINAEPDNSHKPKNQLDILTFNAGLFELKIFGYPMIKPADYLQERLEMIPDELIKTNADIIALQEVYLKSHQDFIINKLEADYPYYVYQRNKSIKINNGLMILSKYPLCDVKYYPFNSRGPIDERTAAQKGILTAQVHYNEKDTLLLVNIHPTSGGFVNKQDSKKILKIRESQITQAMNIANERNKKSIILGDFNTGPGIAKENYDILPENGFVDTYLDYSKKTKTAALITWDNKNYLNEKGTHSESISQRIDHIFLSPELSQTMHVLKSMRVFDVPNVKVPDRKVTLSDHYGLLTSLKF